MRILLRNKNRPPAPVAHAVPFAVGPRPLDDPRMLVAGAVLAALGFSQILDRRRVDPGGWKCRHDIGQGDPCFWLLLAPVENRQGPFDNISVNVFFLFHAILASQGVPAVPKLYFSIGLNSFRSVPLSSFWDTGFSCVNP